MIHKQQLLSCYYYCYYYYYYLPSTLVTLRTKHGWWVTTINWDCGGWWQAPSIAVTGWENIWCAPKAKATTVNGLLWAAQLYLVTTNFWTWPSLCLLLMSHRVLLSNNEPSHKQRKSIIPIFMKKMQEVLGWTVNPCWISSLAPGVHTSVLCWGPGGLCCFLLYYSSSSTTTANVMENQQFLSSKEAELEVLSLVLVLLLVTEYECWGTTISSSSLVNHLLSMYFMIFLSSAVHGKCRVSGE